jgi:hypothetical protein
MKSKTQRRVTAAKLYSLANHHGIAIREGGKDHSGENETIDEGNQLL